MAEGGGISAISFPISIGGGRVKLKPPERLRPPISKTGISERKRARVVGGFNTPTSYQGFTAQDVLRQIQDLTASAASGFAKGMQLYMLFEQLKALWQRPQVMAIALPSAATRPVPGPAVSRPTTPQVGGRTMPMSFAGIPLLGDGYNGGSILGDLAGLAGGIGSMVSAFRAPTQTPVQTTQEGLFGIPGVDLRSPIVSESTTAAENACQWALSPWHRGATASSLRPQLHIEVNPETGKVVHFAPVRITGVKPYNTGIRRNHRCSCRPRRRKR